MKIIKHLALVYVMLRKSGLSKIDLEEDSEMMTQGTLCYAFYARFFNHTFDDAQLNEAFGKMRRLNSFPLNPKRKYYPQYLAMAQFLVARALDDENDLGLRRFIASEWYSKALATDKGLIENLLPESARSIINARIVSERSRLI